MIAVVDYEAGNLTSVVSALNYLGVRFAITKNPQQVISADKVIFPGVGEARQAMGVLRSTGLGHALCDFAASGKPLLGICLGCQILLDYSEERDTPLLGIIPGRVRLFPAAEGIKVPQIGWNRVEHKSSPLFRGIPCGSSFYFVHSYYLSPQLEGEEESPWVTGTAHHGIRFAAAVSKGNVWGTQFHPEKSGPKGLKLLENFVNSAAGTD